MLADTTPRNFGGAPSLHIPGLVDPKVYRDITRYLKRAAFDDQIQHARETLEKLLALLQSAPSSVTLRAASYHQVVLHYRKLAGGWSLGFEGDYRQWEHLIGD